MKQIIAFFILVVLVTVIGCGSKSGNRLPKNCIIIRKEDGRNDGRPMFTVRLPNDSVYTHMYAEEVASGLLTGAWTYDETLDLKVDEQ